MTREVILHFGDEFGDRSHGCDYTIFADGSGEVDCWSESMWEPQNDTLTTKAMTREDILRALKLYDIPVPDCLKS